MTHHPWHPYPVQYCQSAAICLCVSTSHTQYATGHQGDNIILQLYYFRLTMVSRMSLQQMLKMKCLILCLNLFIQDCCTRTLEFYNTYSDNGIKTNEENEINEVCWKKNGKQRQAQIQVIVCSLIFLCYIRQLTNYANWLTN